MNTKTKNGIFNMTNILNNSFRRLTKLMIKKTNYNKIVMNKLMIFIFNFIDCYIAFIYGVD